MTVRPQVAPEVNGLDNNTKLAGLKMRLWYPARSTRLKYLTLALKP